MEFFLRQVYPLMIDASSFSPILPFIVGLFLFRRKKSWQFRLFFLYVCLLLASEMVGWLTVYLGTSNNIWILHVFTPLEFTMLSAIYYFSFRKALVKRTILFTSIGFVIFSVFYSLNVEGVNQMNSTAKMIGNALIIMMVLTYFYKVADDLNNIYLDRDAVFLLSCGILIHKAGTSMSFALFNQALAQSYDAARICITVLVVLNILYNISLMFVLKRTAAA